MKRSTGIIGTAAIAALLTGGAFTIHGAGRTVSVPPSAATMEAPRPEIGHEGMYDSRVPVSPFDVINQLPTECQGALCRPRTS